MSPIYIANIYSELLMVLVIVDAGLMCDILWSDPQPQVSRARGYLISHFIIVLSDL